MLGIVLHFLECNPGITVNNILEGGEVSHGLYNVGAAVNPKIMWLDCWQKTGTENIFHESKNHSDSCYTVFMNTVLIEGISF